MAKTLAQGRKPGSGRKPGKGKTLREGRKPGSGRRRRVDENAAKMKETDCQDIDSRSRDMFVNNALSTRDLEAVDALRELNTSPSETPQQLLTPDTTPMQLKYMVNANEEFRGSTQELIDLNRNLNFSSGFMYTRGELKPVANMMKSNEITNILNTPVPQPVQVNISHPPNTKSHEHNGDSNQNLSRTNQTENVLIST